MKWKFYLRTVCAALAVVAATTGCDNNEPDDPISPPLPPNEQFAFSVAVTAISHSSASLTVTPDTKSAQATWYCSVVEKTIFDAAGSDAAYIQDDLKYLKSEADRASQTLEEYLKTMIQTGTKTVPFTQLDASTDYIAYAYGITSQGAVTSPLAKYAFTTTAAPVTPDELGFEFSVTNITKTAADVNVIPSNNDDTYYFDVQMVAAFDGMTDEQILAEVIDGLTAADLSRGPDGLTAEMFDLYAPLKPGTEYYVYAVGFDPDKGATTKLAKYTFTTEAATGTAPELTLTAVPGDENGANTATNIYCTAYAPGSVSGLYVGGLKSVVDDLVTQGATLDEIVTANGDEMTAKQLELLNTEPGFPLTFINLSPKTSYTFIYKVTGEGGLSTIKSVDVTTTESTVKPSDMTFTFSVTDVTSTSASIVITPSNNTDTYFFDVQKKSLVDSFEGNLAALISAFNNAYADYGGVGGMLSTGEERYSPTKLSPGTDYCVVVFGYAEGVATTGLVTHEFKTESAATSDLTFAITTDPSQPIAGGVTATITPSNNDETYLFAFTLADEIDSMTSDEEIIAYYEEMYGAYIQWLTYAGVYETMAADFGGELAMMPGADYYIVVFGYGESGATTGVTKTRITAGAGPDPVGTTFSFNVTGITDTAADVEVNASKEPVAYMWDILAEADYNELGGNAEGISAYIAEEFKYYEGFFTPRQVIAGLGAWWSGATYAYSTLDPETVYIPFAVCVDVNGSVVDTPVIGESFTTLAAASGASVPKFFGRYEMGDLSPKIYRPMERNAAASRRVEAQLRKRSASAAAAVPAIVRGTALKAAPARRASIEVEVRQLGEGAPERVSPKQAAGRQLRRTEVRTPRR